MQIINGKAIAFTLQQKLINQLKALSTKPKLSVILVGEDAASAIYTRNKKRKAEEIGMISSIISLPDNTSEQRLLKIIEALNNDEQTNGILVQLPLPRHIDPFVIINSINPIKDVDCFHNNNIGRLVIGKHRFIPCTPYGCLYLIKNVLENNLSGLDALIVGRSNIVGKPMAHLLLQENCTVTIAHSRTKHLDEKCEQADIIIAAAGQPNLIKHAKTGATIIDVGINKVNGNLVGDVDFATVSKIAGAITPVPGGVGPMTIIFLLANTLLANSYQNDQKITINDITQQ